MKKCLIIQLRPEDATSDSEFAAIHKHGGLSGAEVTRLRAEKYGIPTLNLDSYFAIIVGGSPFNVSAPIKDKSETQRKVEVDLSHLFVHAML